MKYEVKFTTQFKKDLKLVKKQNKNLHKLYDVIEKLAKGEKLEEKYKDHFLSGNYKGCRECHVEPDWLLVYEVYDDVLVLLMYRTGSHSELLIKTKTAKLQIEVLRLFFAIRLFYVCTSNNVIDRGIIILCKRNGYPQRQFTFTSFVSLVNCQLHF